MGMDVRLVKTRKGKAASAALAAAAAGVTVHKVDEGEAAEAIARLLLTHEVDGQQVRRPQP